MGVFVQITISVSDFAALGFRARHWAMRVLWALANFMHSSQVSVSSMTVDCVSHITINKVFMGISYGNFSDDAFTHTALNEQRSACPVVTGDDCAGLVTTWRQIDAFMTLMRASG